MTKESYKKPFHSSFKIMINGESLVNHEIDIKLLADSLVGVSEILEETNTKLNGKNSDIFVKVKGSPKEGSFEVDIVTILLPYGVEYVKNISDFIGFTNLIGIGSGFSLLTLYKLLRGKKIDESSVKNIDGDCVNIENSGDHQIITIKQEIYKLYINDKIHDNLKKMLSPFLDKGISDICYKDENDNSLIIKRNEILDDEDNKDNEEEIIISDIIRGFLFAFNPDLKGHVQGWKFSIDENGSPYKTIINDIEFLKNVELGKVSFKNGTYIYADYKIIQKKHIKITTTLEVSKIISVHNIDESPIKFSYVNKKLF